MAQIAITADDLKCLEQTRQRLQQLTNNIASLKQDVLQNQLLPNWHSLQATAVILANNIQALTSHLSKNSALLSSTVVYPIPNYPGREQEGLLGQLLRKKFEPEVESWVENGKKTAMELQHAEQEEEEKEEELKTWAAEWIAVRIAKYALEEAGNTYTTEEKEKGFENIRTGLKNPPKIDDDVNDDDDDDDDDSD
ncbi:Mediator of RNA polymerase II transcription subunit 8 [Erysiphe neolycopersici]|uniref:Mediator of RNA polymerase II transcription subunit 8 n=1 Tax=Erysiphe neolycopersici TaxID=212602 RepID=A0A420HM46_9PEZI|nr:Mediator of RNA polymerase II transcription subunit 8 [Erysiphe neolycopersici]